MSIRFVRGQGRATLRMGHARVSAIAGAGGFNGDAFQGGQIAGNSTFDPSGVNKSFSALQGEPMFYKTKFGVPQWAAWWPTIQGGPGASSGYSARVEDIRALADGGCLVSVTIPVNSTGPVNKQVEVQNADGTVAFLLDVSAGTPHLLVDQSSSPENNQYLARYDADGDCLWVKRYGGNAPSIDVGGFTYQYTSWNIEVDEDAELFFVWTCWYPANASAGQTLGAGFGEANAIDYTTNNRNRRAGVSLVYNLATGELVEGDYHRGVLTFTGASPQLYQDGAQVRQTLDGERLDVSAYKVSSRSNSAPALDIDINVNGPGTTLYRPETNADNTRWSQLMVYHAVADAGPTWIVDHILQQTGAFGLNTGDKDAQFGSARIGATQVYGSVCWDQLPNTFTANLRMRQGNGIYSNKLLVNANNWGANHSFLFKFDKADGFSNYAVTHAAVTTTGLRVGRSLQQIIHLDEDRDLLVCSLTWGGTGGNVRFDIGGSDTDVAMAGTRTDAFVFFRASTLGYLGIIKNTGTARRSYQRPLVINGNLLRCACQYTNGTVLDDGGPNQEATPALAANNSAWGFVDIDLDTLEHVPGSLQTNYVYDTSGLLVTPESFTYDAQ